MSHEHGPGTRECREIFERLSEYLDGELSPDLCAQLEGHLGDCPPCVAFLESLRRTVRWTASVDAPALPEEVRDRVREAWRRLQDG
jgi:RNA polymerase sigma-70 factor (ECF subfamily)